VPILFDFDRPKELTMLESVLFRGGLKCFVIADPRSEVGAGVRQDRRASTRCLSSDHPRELAEDEVVAYVEGRSDPRAVVRYRDEAHLRSILDSEILKAGETPHDALKPRAFHLQRHVAN
jgi:hypothetical protein